jgi:hypothetical protein
MTSAPFFVREPDRGTALVIVLMAATLLGALSAAIVLVVMSDGMASANHGAGQQTLYAADAALEATLGELRVTDWRMLPGGAVSGRLWDGVQAPRAPDGTILDLARLTAERQAESDGLFALSPNRPVWHLFAHAPFTDLTPGVVVPPAYLLVWVADDGDEGDGDAERDSNDVLVVRAEALGVSGAHRSVEATICLQTADSVAAGAGGDSVVPRREVRVLSWREAR